MRATVYQVGDRCHSELTMVTALTFLHSITTWPGPSRNRVGKREESSINMKNPFTVAYSEAI
jgi:hypothetical protein